ncbi:MAG: hypothetical protein WC486_00210 [Candidatus Omnitrophota bacterium]
MAGSLSNEDLVITLRLVDQASSEIKKVDVGVKGFTGSLKSLASAFGVAFSATAVVSFAKDSIAAFGQQELAVRKLQTAVTNAGHSWEASSSQVDQYLDSVKRATAFSDDEAIASLQEMLVYTNDLTKATEGSRLAMDMASSGLFDLSAATRYVGMALEGNVEMLGRYIPELKSGTDSHIELMDSAEKTAYALELLQKKFGGMASNELDTYNGQVKKLGNSMDELKEKVGELIVRWTNLKDVTSFWSDTIDNLLGKSTSNATTGVNQLVTALQAATVKVQELYDAQGNSPEYQMADQNRVAIVAQLQRLINSETSSRAQENYGADMTSISYEEYQEEFEGALDDRIASISDFNDESAMLAEAATTKEFESNLELSQQLEELDYKDLLSKEKTAKSEIELEAAKNAAISKSVETLYHYQFATASNIASIMSSAAQLSGNSWLDAAAAIINGLSQVAQIMLEIKAISAGLNFWETAYYATAMVAVGMQTAAAIASIQEAKQSLSEATVQDLVDNLPQAAEGAHINRGGLIRVHDNETVVPAQVSAYAGGSGGGISISISIAEAKLNSPSNMKEFVNKLKDEIGYLVNREIGRPRTVG